MSRRPYTDDDLESLCNHIATGGTLAKWAEKNDRLPRHATRWVRSDPDRLKAYREARSMQADVHIDGLIDLADTQVGKDEDGKTDSAAVNQLRLRVDTRKWVASKFYPAMYGDKLEIDTNLNLSTMKPDEIMGYITDLFAAHGLKVVPDEPVDGPDGTG